MTRKCFVRGCSSGYASENRESTSRGKRRRTLFSTPRCEELRNKWNAALARDDRTLSANDSVCELHFHDSDVEKCYQTKMPDGTIHRIERGRYKLKLGAIPSAFVIKRSEDAEDRATSVEKQILKENDTNLSLIKITKVETEHTCLTNFNENFTEDDLMNEQVQSDDENIFEEFSKDHKSLVTKTMEELPQQTLENSIEICQEDSSLPYSTERLKFDLDKFRLPKGWAYIFVGEGLHLCHLSLTGQPDLNLLIDGNMEMKISTGDNKATLQYPEELKSFQDFLSNLKTLEILANSPCQGTGFDNSRAVLCTAFCTKKLLSRRYCFKRCSACRLLRNQKLSQERSKRLNDNKQQKRANLLRSLKRKNARLQGKVLKLKKIVDTAMKRIALLNTTIIKRKIGGLNASQEIARTCFIEKKKC
ncbi:uncharacterized protein [Neodiprion pinetum]|uniref:Uncharacterized protein LOC124294542 isoform X1 n=1 Tax=Neodiprion lecontei TaxID=441921 RepID=A0ABM3G799_NEOLC|nr:uncharacterized protein LOC124219733 isoform X1 [Neodiprion pinetum]XP_046483724.1 uncharacterized protein LOC124219733 isoform X1 [Neodiprion pinetum]XP_046596149.1 uncharacterized protein LOC124294542 isoform X1 [Neodiprion lecontei]XP_046596150.1 uncharacterized protein LOC124294542 isoform X1 [Neodiprion lecontei]XP_046596151.1 uncharacterized protein LOC124294542 isoform X1 [Neodiprion lecontei]